MFENHIHSKIQGPKRDDKCGHQGEHLCCAHYPLLSGELNQVYDGLNIYLKLKSRNANVVLVRKCLGKDHFEK
jgi:hypothetical protein